MTEMPDDLRADLDRYQSLVRAYEALDERIDGLLASYGGNVDQMSAQDKQRYREMFRQRDELLKDGQGTDQTTPYSLANVLRLRRPFVVVDEAHNSRTELAFDMLARFRPSGVMELTATPDLERTLGNLAGLDRRCGETTGRSAGKPDAYPAFIPIGLGCSLVSAEPGSWMWGSGSVGFARIVIHEQANGGGNCRSRRRGIMKSILDQAKPALGDQCRAQPDIP